MNEESLRLYESIGFMKKAKTGHGRKPIPSDPFAFFAIVTRKFRNTYYGI